MILFKKEVRETEIDLKNDIMVTHRYLKISNNQYPDSDSYLESDDQNT